MAKQTKPDSLEEIWATTGAIVDPGTTKVELGWEAEIPPYQHFNYIMNKYSEMLQHVNQMGIPEWDTNTEYQAGSWCSHNGTTYVLESTSTSTGEEPGVVGDWLAINIYGLGYDYVVDSDAKLQALCDGTVTGVTSVLVASGTWSATEDSSWNLTTTGTKKVTGISGANLAFVTGGEAVSYTSLPITEISVDYVIENLTITNDCTGKTGITDAIAVENIPYIRNCAINAVSDLVGSIARGVYESLRVEDSVITVSGDGGISVANVTEVSGCTVRTTTTNDQAYGLRTCSRVHNCTIIATSASNIAYAVRQCDNVTNTTATGTNTDDSTYGGGFYQCDRVTNCTGSGSGRYGIGFYICNYLTNCSGDGTATLNNGTGFFGCDYISNSAGTGTNAAASTTNPGAGFGSCDYVTNCKGTGTGTGSYGFWNCEYVYAPSEDSSGVVSTFYNTNGVQTNTALS